MIQTDIYLDKTDGYLCYEDQYGVKQPVVVNTAFYAKNLELDPSTGHLIVHAADGTSKPIEDAGGMPVSLMGPSGPTGPSGPAGTTPNIGTNGNWWIGTTDTGVPASGGSVNISQLEADVASLQATVSSLSASQGFDHTYTKGTHTALEVKTLTNLPAGTYVVNAGVSYSPSLPPILQGACLVVNPSTDKDIYKFGEVFTLVSDSEVCIVYAPAMSAKLYLGSSLTLSVFIDGKISITHLNIDRIDDITKHITTSIDPRLTTIESQVTALDGDIKTLQTQVTTLDSDVSTLKSDITTLDGDVKALESKLVASIDLEYTYKVGDAGVPIFQTISSRIDGKRGIVCGDVFTNGSTPYDGVCIVTGSTAPGGGGKVYKLGEMFEKPLVLCHLAYANYQFVSDYLNGTATITPITTETTVQVQHLQIISGSYLNDSVDAIEQAVTDITSITSDVASIQTDVTSITADITSMQTDVTAVKSDIASVKSDVATIDTKLSGVTASFPTPAEPFDTYLWTGKSRPMKIFPVPCGYVETGVVYQYLPGGVVPSTYESTEFHLTESVTGTSFVAADQYLAKQMYNTIKMNSLTAYKGVVVDTDGNITTSPENYLPLQKLISADPSLRSFVVSNAGTPIDWTVTIVPTGALDPNKMYWIPINEVLATV